MDLAEAHMRNGGYAGFSFRDLAAELGIKSASVHHHFPTKATMAAAVARRYAERFFAAVARHSDAGAEDGIAAYRSAFKAALGRDAATMNKITVVSAARSCRHTLRSCPATVRYAGVDYISPTDPSG